MDGKPDWWEKFCENVRNLPELKKPTLDLPVYDYSNEFMVTAPCPMFNLDSDDIPGSIYYTGWADDEPGPSAKVLLHPAVRNYWHISALEQRTGRTAVAHRGYVELVKV